MNMIFIYTIITLLILGLVAGLAHWIRRWRYRQMVKKGIIDEVDIPPTLNPADMECCGQHEVCEKESLLAALSRQIEYYDDEELDRFRGRKSNEYSEEEIDEFRNILYTMRSDEVAGWGRSLQLRQVELPDEVKDELFLIIGERRSGA